MDLVQIDEVGLEPPQTGFHLGQHVLATRPSWLLSRGCLAVDFGGDDEVIAVACLQPAAQDLLRHTLGVDVGGVDEGTAGVHKAVENLVSSGFVRLSVGTKGHRPQTQLTDLQARTAKKTCLHDSNLTACSTARSRWLPPLIKLGSQPAECWRCGGTHSLGRKRL